MAFAHFLAAGGALFAIPLTWRCKPQSGAAIDLAPSMHWPAPIVSAAVEADAGPVLVTIEYHVSHGKREMFLMAVDKLARERRRDGAYAWGIFEDVAQSGRFIETFTVESWLEHLRQHERVTNADRVIEEHVHGLLQTSPKITHLVAPRRSADV